MYGVLLVLHNLTRWLVLFAAAWALFQVYSGLIGKRGWTEGDQRAGRVFAGIISLQFVFGLLLYFWPDGLVMGGLRNMGAAMRDDQTRFFLVEHITVMLIAVVLAHIGSSRARKGTTDLRKFRAGAIFYTLSALAILIAIPWWRPLLRLG